MSDSEPTPSQDTPPEVKEFLDNPEKFSAQRLMSMDVDTFSALQKLCKENPILSIALTKALGRRNLKDDYIKEGRRQNQPYYDKKYAEALIPSLDEMIKTNKSIELPYESAARRGWSPNTLRSMVHQAFLYVVDKMDPSGIYAKLRMKTKISCDLPHAIQIIFRDQECVPVFDFRPARTETSYEELLDYVNKALKEMPAGTKVALPSGDILPFKITKEQISELEDLSSSDVIIIAAENNIQIMKRGERE